MPRKPKTPCRHPGCPELTEDRFCKHHQQEYRREYNREQRPEYSRKLYRSTRWRRLRRRFLQDNPLCVECKTVWYFDRPRKSENHPTMKPVALCAYPIQNSSAPNSIVLDPFCGSGSTLIACEQTDRICYSVELDEKYCDVIVKRYMEQVGSDEHVLLLREGQTVPWKNIEKSA